MTRPGIEPRSPGPLPNILPTGPMSRYLREIGVHAEIVGKKKRKSRDWSSNSLTTMLNSSSLATVPLELPPTPPNTAKYAITYT